MLVQLIAQRANPESSIKKPQHFKQREIIRKVIILLVGNQALACLADQSLVHLPKKGAQSAGGTTEMSRKSEIGSAIESMAIMKDLTGPLGMRSLLQGGEKGAHIEIGALLEIPTEEVEESEVLSTIDLLEGIEALNVNLARV